jgi:hypothetical protein
MLLVTGPRLDPAAVSAPPGVEVRGYVPRLYEHLAASDLTITQSGGTTTLELTALRRPFIHLCQHAVRSKATLRRGAAEVAGGFVAWQRAGLPVEEVD